MDIHTKVGENFCVFGDGERAFHWINVNPTGPSSILGMCDHHAQQFDQGGLTPEQEAYLQQNFRRTATTLPHKFVWADGQMAVGPGWLKNVHHMHLMQQLGITTQPQNMYAGTYSEDPFTGQPNIKPDWEPSGNYPSDEELIEQVRQRLQQPQHAGRTARKPW